MHPLLTKQEQLHKEASELLEQIIYPILKEFGEVGIGGSYVYKLLNHPDIDLDITNPNLTKEMYVDLCAKLIALPICSGFKTVDRVNYPHYHTGNRPTGYWLSPEIRFRENVWKMDIWFQIPEWNKGNTNRYEKQLSILSEEDRILILSLKEELLAEKIYGVGKEFESVDIYNGVLEGKVKTVVGLRDFKTTKK